MRHDEANGPGELPAWEELMGAAEEHDSLESPGTSGAAVAPEPEGPREPGPREQGWRRSAYGAPSGDDGGAA